MALINAPTLQDVVYSGESPLAIAHGSVKLAAAAIGDKVRMNLVYAGTKVYDAKIISGALGSGAKIKLGFEYADGSTGGDPAAFINDADCATAGKDESSAAPVMIEKDAYIIATVVGAAATGQLDSVVVFEPKGK